MSPTIISTRNPPKDDIEEEKKFERTLESSKRVLFSAKSVFPFDLFPDEIVIDENKVDIVYGIFFYSREVFSIPLMNINSAKSTTTLLFGELSIELEGYNENPLPVKYLWNSDALSARRIINGLITLQKQNVNLTKLDLTRAKDQVEEIGKALEHVR